MGVFLPPRLQHSFTYENRPPGRFFLGSKFPRCPAFSLLACAKNVPSVPGRVPSSCSCGIEARIGVHCICGQGQARNQLRDISEKMCRPRWLARRPGALYRAGCAGAGATHSRHLLAGTGSAAAQPAGWTLPSACLGSSGGLRLQLEAVPRADQGRRLFKLR